ncbi:hypothetical protein [Paraburkholderia sp. J11-2]|uniref:hypothetical protein n=1 Tax=Paraburkholderia sp. J11-2 TaxID=2805431 RepID=UPI002AB681EB|nr:hypothetical protein [Paraburkholderia sp. J11-2]
MKEGDVATRLQGRIAERMADGSEWTIAQLTRALNASVGGVAVALRKMQAKGEVSDAGCVAQGKRGPSSRVFKRATLSHEHNGAERRVSERVIVARRWPKADPDLTAAMSAMTRHDRD